jgi:putative spermidine/putrescine transport system permease protein
MDAGAGERRGDGPWPHVLLAWPTLALTLLFVVPLGIIAALGFFRRIQAGFFEVAFVTDNYARALDAFHLERLWVSVLLALVATLATLLLAVPFTFAAHAAAAGAAGPVPGAGAGVAVALRGDRRLRLVAAAVAHLGHLEPAGGARPDGRGRVVEPGLWAVLLAYVFIALPLAILSLYPTFSRLDQELPEAAGTMGAAPLVGFVTVVLPLVRRAVAATGALVFIFVLGAYVIPQTLGRPAQWTIPVHITDQAIMKNHLPLAASLAIVLLVASSLIAVAIVAIGAGRLPRSPCRGARDERLAAPRHVRAGGRVPAGAAARGGRREPQPAPGAVLPARRALAALVRTAFTDPAWYRPRSTA